MSGSARLPATTGSKPPPLIAKRFPVVACAMTHVAHLAIRNRGTIGGSLSHADPAAELPMLATLLDAELRIASANGTRTVLAREFFLDALTVDLETAEVVTEIVLPKLPQATGWGFEEVARRHGDFALAAVAVLVTVSSGAIEEARIALTGVGPTPQRAAAGGSLAYRPCARTRLGRPGRRCRASRHRARDRSARLGGLPAPSRRRSRRPAPSRRHGGALARCRHEQDAGDHRHGQRHRAHGERRAAAVIGRFSAPHARPHRHACRLRARRLRRLHRSGRWRQRARVFDACGASRRHAGSRQSRASAASGR